MSQTALNTAFDQAAPADERAVAMREAQAESMPTSIPDMRPLVDFISKQAEESEFRRSLSHANMVPMPTHAQNERKVGMQSLWTDDMLGNGMGEWRERWSGMTFDMMRHMVDQTPVLSAVVLTRQRQVKRFTRVAEKGPGFQIALRDKSAKAGKDEQNSINLLQDFMTNCGWEKNPRQRARLRRDNFSGFMTKLVRDSLVMDSAPIETEYKRDKSLGLDGLYAVDGATIRLAHEVGYQGEDEIFALQVVQGNIRATYGYDDLIYVPRNPRTDVLVGGYGFSETELLVKVVTGFLNAFTYNTSYFDKNAIPKGILHMSGNYGPEELSAFKRYWNAMVRGVNNAWSMPVLVSKDQESKANFENFGVDVNEVMFSKWMVFLTSIICAIYGIAPDEINFESFTAGASSLSGSDTEEKLINSKDKGLRPLLAHFEDVLSDFVIAEFGDKYVFRWTGMDEDDAKTQWDKTVATCTVNEARKEQGRDPIKEAWGDAPLNPALIGPWQAEQQASGEDYGDPQQAGAPGGGGDDNGGKGPPPDTEAPDGEFPGDDNGPEMQKSFGLPVFTVKP